MQPFLAAYLFIITAWGQIVRNCQIINQKIRAMNVILYCRVSTDEQADGCSLDMQERYLRAYCNNRNYNIIGEEQPYKEREFGISIMPTFCNCQ